VAKRETPQAAHATVRDVAVLAGVSTATAARALGGYGRVSEAVRAKVTAAAASLGYRPNVLARSMITGTSHTIGVVVADIENPFFASAVRGIADTAREAGFEVVLVNTDEDVEKERAAVGILLEKRVDGLLVSAATAENASHLAEAIYRGLPVVCLDRVVPGLEADAVVVDSLRAAHNAVSHLLRLGHRRIAIVAADDQDPPPDDVLASSPVWGPPGMLPDAARLCGYLTAHRAAGVAVAPELVRRCRYGRETAAAETAAVLRLADPPTAIFTTDAIMTLGAMEAIVLAGRQVPEELSVVAFDDADWIALLRAPLTVVAQPVYELGATATRRLLARIAGSESPPEVIVLDTTFIVRDSTRRIAAVVAGVHARGHEQTVETAEAT
jgi:LacI family transcriptional regulator, galactose operon repressor